MGTRAVTEAIADLQQTSEQSKFKEVILAAPDMNADVFVTEIMPKLATPESHVTIYASSRDSALLLSRYINGDERLGNGQIIYGEHIDFIDATNVKSDFSGHSYFANNDSILSDIYKLIVDDLPVENRIPPLKEETEPSISGPVIYHSF